MPHTDLGLRFVFQFHPIEKLTVEDNFVIRNRKFQDASFQNNIRSNAFTVAYALSDQFSVFGGFSYDSFFAAAFVTSFGERRCSRPPGAARPSTASGRRAWRSSPIAASVST